MIRYPDINPIAFHFGPVAVHWYGLMYLLGFVTAMGLGTWRSKRTGSGWTAEQVMDLIFYSAVGVIVGGRLGYVIFYNFIYYWQHPARIFAVWDGGMSFHGGLLGVAVALALYGRALGKRFLEMTDFGVPLVPLGLAFGRIGNFINGELWGKVTQVPWGIVFPSGGPYPRHPSQLYECFLEGVCLFIIIWCYSSSPKPRGAVSGLFLILYGVFRLVLEFFRMPDVQVGYLAFGWLTEGQLLSVPMILLGGFLLVWAYREQGR